MLVHLTHLSEDTACITCFASQGDQVIVDMISDAALVSQTLVQGPQHLHGHQTLLIVGRLGQLVTEGEDELLRLVPGAERQHGHDAVHDPLHVALTGVLNSKALLADGDDGSQVILQTILTPLSRDISAKVLEVVPQLLRLLLVGDVNEHGHIHDGDTRDSTHFCSHKDKCSERRHNM